MKHSDIPGSPAAKFLASALLAGLALACTDSSDSGKTDGALTETNSSTTSTATPTAPLTNSMGSSTTSATSTTSTTSSPPSTVTNPPADTTATVPLPSDTDPSGPDDDEMGAGGTGGTDPTTDEPSTEPDTTDDPSDVTEPEVDPTDTTTDETEPEMTDETTGETTDMTDEPDTTSGVPDAPQCASVIKGELTDCAITSEADPNFSFFIASRVSMVALSDNPLGFGGNLGGLECADQICALIAECVAPGNAQTWHAFLSTADVDAKDRIGTGPWYDVIGTKIADDASGLIGIERPTTADGVVNHNLPNEFGCENLTPACDDVKEDNHHVMTGSTPQGVLSEGRTCNDWTSTDATPGTGPAVGLSWERQLFNGGMGGGFGGGSQHWLNFANESGCAPGGNLTNDPPMGSNDGTVGSGGGYGAIYCFAVVE